MQCLAARILPDGREIGIVAITERERSRIARRESVTDYGCEPMQPGARPGKRGAC
jgi:hypothetical protein